MKTKQFTKTLGVLAVGSMLLTQAPQAESVGLIGVGVTAYTFDTLDSLGLSNSYTAPALTLKLGAKNEDFRFLLGYSFIADETVAGSTAANTYILGQLDYMFYNIPTNSGAIRPYIGFVVGYEEYKYNDTIDESGGAYGGEIGAIWDFETFSIDAGISYMDSSLDSVNDAYGFTLGFNYKIY